MAAVTICVILEPKKIKPVTVSIVSSSICYEVMGPDAIILALWTLSTYLLIVNSLVSDSEILVSENKALFYLKGFPGDSDGKESTCNVGDLDSIPGLGSSPRGGHGNPLQYCFLEKPHGQWSLAGYRPWGGK